MVSFITFFRGREAGILSHGPQFASIHVWLNAAGERKGSGGLVASRLCVVLTVDFLYFNLRVRILLFFFRHGLINSKITSNQEPTTINAITSSTSSPHSSMLQEQ